MTHPKGSPKPSQEHVSPLPVAELTSELKSDVWSVCGRFGRPHGVRGEVRLWVYNNLTELLVSGTPVFVGHHPKKSGQAGRPPRFQLTLKQARIDAKGVIANFDEISNREGADALKHLAWLTPRSAFPTLEDDEFYLADLIGAQGLLFTQESTAQDLSEAQDLGELVGMVEAGAGEILIFKSEAWGEVMVPNVDPFVISIDLDVKQVKVRAIPGLIEGGL